MLPELIKKQRMKEMKSGFQMNRTETGDVLSQVAKRVYTHTYKMASGYLTDLRGSIEVYIIFK